MTVRQVTATLPEETVERLDDLARLRWGGNRSGMMAFAVELAAVVLTHPALAERLYSTPDDALAAFVAAKGRKG